MKSKILFLVIIVLSVSYFAVGQTSVPETLSDVVTADSIPKSRLYENAKAWLLTKFMTADNLVEFDDKEQNSIIITGHIKMSEFKFVTGWQGIFVHTGNNTLTFKLELGFKDDKFKYEISNMLYSYYLHGPPTVEGHKESTFDKIADMPKKKVEEVRVEANDILNALIVEMKTKVISNKNKNDW